MEEAQGKAADRFTLLTRYLSPFLLSGVQMDAGYFRRCLAEHPRLIIVLAHGGPISFLPPAVALLRATAEYDPGRRSLITLHPWWWKAPGIRLVPRYFSGGQQHLTMPELRRALAGQSSVDYYALPESENCFYGNPDEVKPFLVHGFIELSIVTRTPMLLVVHKGTERWNRQIGPSGRLLPLFKKMPDRMFHAVELNKDRVLSAIERYQSVNVPLPLARAQLRLAFELHYPELYDSEPSSDFRTRRRQYVEEGERIRARMQWAYDALR